MSELTHFDRNGSAHMVDVSGKEDTHRTAVAEGTIALNAAAFAAVQSGTAAKGDVLGTARLAGIMAAKRTFEQIPLCHLLALTHCSLDFTLHPDTQRITARCTTKTTGKTGVEMEALNGVTTALLTIYDMCKAVDKWMELGEIHLCHKDGGKSGWLDRPNPEELP